MIKKNILFLIFLIIITFLSCVSNNEKDDSILSIKKYLQNNIINFDGNPNEATNISILDKDIENSRVILAGELHFFNKNNDIILSLLKYLNNKYNIRFIVGEYSFSYMKIFDKAIQTGDLSLIIKNNRLKFKEQKQFLENLYHLNQTLPEIKKIHFIGIDKEYDFVDSLIYMFQLVQNKSFFNNKDIESIITLYNQIEGKYKTNISQSKEYFEDEMKYINLIQSIKTHNIRNPNDLKSILKNDYDDFMECIKRNLHTQEFYNELKKYGIDKYSHSQILNSKRDLLMYENMINVLEKYPDEKFFGSFGLYHIFQLKESTDYTSLCQHLTNNKKYKGKILSLPIIYKNIDGQYNEQRFLKDQYADLFYNLAYSEFSIFKLNSGKSPFTKKGKNILFYYPKNLIPKISTVDNFQYVIVINGVSKMKLLEE